MGSYKDYKQSVAPLYKSEMERRLFATASGDKSRSLREEVARLLRRDGWRKPKKREDSEEAEPTS